jgi:phage tail sheath gpL-like
MTIQHSIPSTVRKPGEYHEIDVVSAAQGLVPLDNAVLLVGAKTADGTATANIPYEVTSQSQADTLFGAGSEAALMYRAAAYTARRKGFQPRTYVTCVAAPGGGTAAIHRITVTAGTADAAGDIVLRVGNITIRAGVSEGDDQDAIAAAIEAAIGLVEDLLPVTAAISGAGDNIVDLTYRWKGENGNDLNIVIDDVGLTGMTVAATVQTAGVGVTDMETALNNALSGDYEAIAIANHKAADIADAIAHLDDAWAAEAKKWRFIFTALNDSLGTAQTLQGSCNEDYRISIVSCEDAPNLPSEIAAAQAMAFSMRSQPNYNYDNDELPGLGVPADAAVYTPAEIESALAAGVTPLIPNSTKTALKTVRLVTTKTLHNGVAFERTKDMATIRGMVYAIRQIDAKAASQFRGVNLSDQVIKRIKSMILSVLESLEDLEILRDVEALKSQLIVERDELVATRLVASVPEKVVENLHQIIFKHILFQGSEV